MNHYDVLQVSPKASAEVLRAAYKSLMQRYHPDKNPGGTQATLQATQQTSRIAQAYDVLSDPVKRAAYDLELRSVAESQVQQRFAARAGTAARRTPSRPAAAMTQQPWYVWGLVVFIVVAGSMLLLSKKGSPLPVVPTPENAPIGTLNNSLPVSVVPSAGTPAMTTTVAAAMSEAEIRARTVDAFATSLYIDLALGPLDKPDTLRVLAIPQLGLRVKVADYAPWLQKIDTQRAAILRKLLERLAAAHHANLVGVEGDLTLRRLVATTVSESIGLDEVVALPSGLVTVPAGLNSLEVLLPQSYSVR